MGFSNYKLTDEQKGELNDIVHDIIEQIEIKSEEHSCLDVTARKKAEAFLRTLGKWEKA